MKGHAEAHMPQARFEHAIPTFAWLQAVQILIQCLRRAFVQQINMPDKDYFLSLPCNFQETFDQPFLRVLRTMCGCLSSCCITQLRQWYTIRNVLSFTTGFKSHRMDKQFHFSIDIEINQQGNNVIERKSLILQIPSIENFGVKQTSIIVENFDFQGDFYTRQSVKFVGILHELLSRNILKCLVNSSSEKIKWRVGSIRIKSGTSMVNNKRLGKCPVNCGDHKRPLLTHVLSHMNRVLILQFYIVKIHFNNLIFSLLTYANNILVHTSI